jgi:isopentenyl-diphosphate delta-isomerase
LQEWLQPEGDRFRYAPLVTIKTVLDTLPDVPIIVKEVGQGMGLESLRALLQLPLAAVDFAASGGTNFAKLELLRSDQTKHLVYEPLAKVGHTASEMVDLVNDLKVELGDRVQCEHIIISGGIQTFLDGYYLKEKINFPSIYGQASPFLRYAQEDYEQLRTYVQAQARGLKVAETFLRLK